MKRIHYFSLISDLFQFKIITDEQENEYVIFAKSQLNHIENIIDKTEFEAIENHIHLLDNLKKDEYENLIPTAKALGQTLLNSLKHYFPHKHFFVFVTLQVNDSMIIRFHQKWENEMPYYNPSDFISKKEMIFSFES